MKHAGNVCGERRFRWLTWGDVGEDFVSVYVQRVFDIGGEPDCQVFAKGHVDPLGVTDD